MPIIKIIKQLFVGGQAFVWFLKSFWRHQHFLQKHFIPTLNTFFQVPDSSPLTKAEYAKILNYATLVPIFVSHNTATLYGKKLAHHDLLRQVHLAAITPLVDEFYETAEPNARSNLKKLLRFPDQYQAINNHERLTLFLWQQILINLTHADQFHLIVNQILEYQENSTKQKDNLTVSALHQITFNKGGYSMLLFQTALPFALTVKTRELFYQIGAGIQLLDDLLDVYEDSRAGISTLATLPDPTVAFLTFEQTFYQIQQQCQELFPPKQARLFVTVLFLIFASGFVTVYRLKKLLLQSDKKDFRPKNYQRSELVTDMAKVKNWLIAIKYYFTLIQ